MKKLSIIIGLLFIAVSCREEPISIIKNGDFTIEKLFEHDGCTMYRFVDGSRYIYWSDCRGKIQSDHIKKSGKSGNNVPEETITTE